MAAGHDCLRERRDVDRDIVSIGLGLAEHAAEEFQEEQVDADHVPPRGIRRYSVGAYPSVQHKRAAAELVGHALPGPVVWLGAGSVALMADANGRLEDLGVEALERLVARSRSWK